MWKRRVLWYFVLTFVFINGAVWAVYFFPIHNPLVVSFLNVGQGDAIFIQSPTGVQILVDGGRDRSVLRELTKRMGPLDRSIDMVVATHPDADHIGGLSGVFQNYSVSRFLTSHIESDTNTAAQLTDAVVREKGLVVVNALRGTRFYIGAGAYLDVLFPDRDVSFVETNTGSVVLRVVYQDTSFMLTGDSPSAIEDWLVALDGNTLASNILKAGHHGSRTSTDELWLTAVDPDIVIISAGKNNSYGHPHQEVLQRISASGASTLSTVDGAVTLISDGVVVKQK